MIGRYGMIKCLLGICILFAAGSHHHGQSGHVNPSHVKSSTSGHDEVDLAEKKRLKDKTLEMFNHAYSKNHKTFLKKCPQSTILNFR